MGHPHKFYNDEGCQVGGSADDHARLWHIRGNKPTAYIYTFYEYSTPKPAATLTEIDSRGLKHSIHPTSWAFKETPLHVVTTTENPQTYPYEMQLPRDEKEFVEMYRAVMGEAFPSVIKPQDWENFLAEHNREYGL
jgi:hypothetical protein